MHAYTHTHTHILSMVLLLGAVLCELLCLHLVIIYSMIFFLKSELLHFLFLRVLLYLQICLLVTHDFKLSWIYWFLERYLSSSIYIWYLIILIFEVLWVQPITSFVHDIIFFVVVSDFFFFFWAFGSYLRIEMKVASSRKKFAFVGCLGALWIWAVFNSKFGLCK